jgi:replicative DNA helicase
MERAVLGAILAGHTQASELLHVVKPEDFFDLRHRRIAKVILDLYEAGNRPDLLAVHDEFARSGEAESVGGTPYIASLPEGMALKGDIFYAVRGLRRMASFRQAMHLAENIKQLAHEQAGSAESLLDSAVEKFSSLARDLESTEDDGMPYFDSATQALSIAREGARLKIYTDIDKLDQWTGGFREGELVVLTAETGTGKSLLAAQIRARACRDNPPSVGNEGS